MTARGLPLLAVLLSGCQCDARSPLVDSTGVPQTPKQLNFGNVQVGQTVQLKLPLVNSGTGALGIDTQTVSGPPFSELSPFRGALGPGAHGTATVAFTPAQPGPASGTLTLSDDGDPSQVVVSLVGTGLDLDLAVDPASLAFGQVPVGVAPSPALAVTFLNDGSQPIGLSVSSAATASEYALVDATGAPISAATVPLQPNTSSVVTVIFTPDTVSIFDSSFSYTVCADAASSMCLSPQSIPLSGQGIGDDTQIGTETDAGASLCQLTFSPSSVFFDPISVGAPLTEVVTLANGGGTDCEVTAIAIDPASDPSYALASGQPTNLTLAPGADAGIAVTFDLNSDGPPPTRRGDLDFQSNDQAHASVRVPLAATLASPYAGGGAWPRWHHDNVQSGLSPVDTSGLVGRIAWTFPVGVPPPKAGGVLSDYLNSPVVGSDGTIFQMGMDGNLYAVNPDGGLQWASPLQSPALDPHPSTPIVMSDGTLFVAFGETVGSAAYGLYHVSGAGAVLASIPPEEGGDGFDLPPVLTNGGLLLGADDFTGAFAYAIDGDGDFDVIANMDLIENWDQISAVVGPDDTTYWCGGSACMALSPPDAGFGRLPTWNGGALKALGGVGCATSDLALDTGVTGNLMVLLGGWNPTFAGFDALAAGFDGGEGPQLLTSVVPASGQIVWTDTLPGPAPAQLEPGYTGWNDATVGNSCPAIGTDGTVYVGNFDGLHAVDGTTGAEKPGFPFLTSADDVITAPAIGGDGTIFFGTAGGTFYAINADGTLRFKLPAGGRIAGSPAIGPSGAIYFTADDGNLYAVQ